jgi:hypothetical protein
MMDNLLRHLNLKNNTVPETPLLPLIELLTGGKIYRTSRTRLAAHAAPLADMTCGGPRQWNFPNYVY